MFSFRVESRKGKIEMLKFSEYFRILKFATWSMLMKWIMYMIFILILHNWIQEMLYKRNYIYSSLIWTHTQKS